MAKISIIIPIYGVENCIERCARSLFEQTFIDIEFIFIDDCSPDNSVIVLKKIMDDYPHRKEQVKIVRLTKNEGLPCARRKGIEIANGDYIMHCDSDDWMDVNMCSRMYEKAVTESADLVVCNYFISTDDKNTLKTPEVVGDKYSAMFTNVAMWQKIVRADIYKRILFYPVDNMWEDRVFSAQLVYFAKKIAYISEPLYHYYVNNNGICRSLSTEQIIRRYTGCINNIKLIQDFSDLMGITNETESYLFDLKRQALFILAPATNHNEYYHIWKKSYPEVHRALLSKRISLINKLKYVLMYLRLFPTIKKIL